MASKATLSDSMHNRLPMSSADGHGSACRESFGEEHEHVSKTASGICRVIYMTERDVEKLLERHEDSLLQRFEILLQSPVERQLPQEATPDTGEHTHVSFSALTDASSAEILDFANNMTLTQAIDKDEMRRKTDATLGKKRRSSQDSRLRGSARGSLTHILPKVKHTLMRKLAVFLHGALFETMVALAIVTNSLVIGIETEFVARSKLAEPPFAFKIISYTYSSIFFLEFGLRLLVEGPTEVLYTSDSRVTHWFDLFLIVCSIGEILAEIALTGSQEVQNSNVIRIVRMLRTLRLSRTMRIPSVIRFVNALHLLVYSIVATLRSLFWAGILMLIIIYIFGIVFTQVVAYHNAQLEDLDGKLDLFWGSLGSSMFTLYKSVTGGISWTECSTSLEEIGILWVALFTAYVSFMYFAVLNVVTGVFCNSAIEAASREPDLLLQNIQQEQYWCSNNLQNLFKCLDRYGSGVISLHDLETCLQSEHVVSLFKTLDLEVDDAWMLFRLIDVEQKGDISIEEFVKACMHLRGAARNYDLTQLKYDTRRMMKKLGQIAGEISSELRKDLKERRTFEHNIRRSVETRMQSFVASPETSRAINFGAIHRQPDTGITFAAL